MNETLIRAISGFFYIAILISAIFLGQQTLLAVLFIFGLISCWELNRLLKSKNPVPYIQLTLIFAIVAFHPENDRKTHVLLILAIISALTNLFLAYKLFKLEAIKLKSLSTKIIPLAYLSTSIALLGVIPSTISEYNPLIILGIMIIIWANDTFAYLLGKNFGKRKLYEKISPKKTIEGFIGGLIFACAAGISIALCCSNLPVYHWVVISLLVAVFGTVGDLVASKFKREAGIKDSSNLIPGHGGFLDRLDSLLFVSSFVYLYLQILNYVS